MQRNKITHLNGLNCQLTIYVKAPPGEKQHTHTTQNINRIHRGPSKNDKPTHTLKEREIPASTVQQHISVISTTLLPILLCLILDNGCARAQRERPARQRTKHTKCFTLVIKSPTGRTSHQHVTGRVRRYKPATPVEARSTRQERRANTYPICPVRWCPSCNNHQPASKHSDSPSRSRVRRYKRKRRAVTGEI